MVFMFEACCALDLNGSLYFMFRGTVVREVLKSEAIG